MWLVVISEDVNESLSLEIVTDVEKSVTYLTLHVGISIYLAEWPSLWWQVTSFNSKNGQVAKGHDLEPQEEQGHKIHEK
jgi:hypothetical protein